MDSWRGQGGSENHGHTCERNNACEIEREAGEAGRLRALIKSLECGEKQPVAVRGEVAVLYDRLGDELIDELTAYLRDEISVKELGVVAWLAQNLPVDKVLPAFVRIARDETRSIVVRVKAAQVVTALTETEREQQTFEEKLAELGLLTEEAGAVLYSLAQESVLSLMEEVGHPTHVEEAIEAALIFQDAVGDDLFNVIPRLVETNSTAAANVLAALAVGGENATVRAQARRALIRLARHGVEPDSAALEELASARYAGAFRVFGPALPVPPTPAADAGGVNQHEMPAGKQEAQAGKEESLHILWQFKCGLVQEAGFLLRRTPHEPVELVDGYISRLFPPPVMAQLIFFPYLPESVVRIEKLTFRAARQLLEEAWAERREQNERLPDSLEAFQGFLDNWILDGELIGASRDNPSVDLMAQRNPLPLLDGVAAKVAQRVEDSLGRAGWNREAIGGALALWAAYVYMARPRLRKVEPWAATVVYVSRTLRGESLKQSEVARAFQVAPATVARNFHDMVSRLNLRDGEGLIQLRLPGWAD